ncbi:S-layer homology domain-containing protein [Paenibacillus algorifonticola]|uniref:S-layer homology domain-containing protein n=1 Tax=Paenibacillus algorifonticola TaxID=684063 RepID=UPI001E5A47F7|nr:S-layer homology domain-containing protein [Paenibacillus algorifonticola]
MSLSLHPKWLSLMGASLLAAAWLGTAGASGAEKVEADKLPQIRIVPSANQVKVGDVFEVAVWLQGFKGSYGGVQGYEVHMKYDSERIAPVVDKEAGALLRPAVFAASASPMQLLNKLDAAAGLIQIAEATAQRGPALFSGYGKLGSLTFKAEKDGAASFSLAKSIIILPDNPGLNIQHRVNEPVVSIGAGSVKDGATKVVGQAPAKAAAQLTGEQRLKQFKDYEAVAKLKWASAAVGELALKQVMQGTAAGDFEPGRLMTRAEFAKAAVLAFELDMKQQSIPAFTDVRKSDWSYDYVETAAANGLLQGVERPQGSAFLPNQPVTRAEIAAVLSRQLKALSMTALSEPPAVSASGSVTLSPPETSTTSSTSDASEAAPTTAADSAANTAAGGHPFTDISGHWAEQDIAYLYEQELLQGRTDKLFAPGDHAIRAEVSVLLNRMMQRLN